jgi:hypothetical protein
MSPKPNYDEFEKTGLERACADAAERLEKNCGASFKFIVVGIGKKHRSICTSPMTQLESVQYLTRAALSISIHIPPVTRTLTERATIYLDDANEVP